MALAELSVYTFLIDNFVCRCFPLFLVEDFDDDIIALDCTIHVFPTNQKDGLIK